MSLQSRRPQRRARRPSSVNWRSILVIVTAPLWLLLAWTTTTLYHHRGDPTVWLVVIIVIELAALAVLRLVENAI